MKVTIYGSHLCPDTLYALNVLKSKDVDLSFKNISGALGDLKEFLAIREGNPCLTAPERAAALASPALCWRMAPAPWIFSALLVKPVNKHNKNTMKGTD